MSQEYSGDEINSEYGLEEIMPIDDILDFDYSIHFVEDDIKGNISILPIDIQKRIYIFTFKKYWREFVPITAQVPSWYNYKIYVDNVLYTARKKNIHFMHLPINTLEQNKKWIMGCQCNYCTKHMKNKKYKKRMYKKQYSDTGYFKSIMPESTESDWNNKFVFDDEGEYLYNLFDPLCGSKYENYERWALRTNEEQIEFENI